MSVSLQFVEPNCTVSPTSEMSQMECRHSEASSSRCAQNHYVEKFTVEKCPMRSMSIGRSPCYGDTDV